MTPHRHLTARAPTTAARLTAWALAMVAIWAPVAARAAEACSAESRTPPPRVVELYTSEGCSSCPPADRWLSTLKGRADVVALGFHVSYWDRLGWADRFASAEATARQYARNRDLGRPNVYTPQVLVDGIDWRDWPRLPDAAKRGSQPVPSVTLTRYGSIVRVEVGPVGAGAGAEHANHAERLAGYWVVLEDGLVSRVRAGENGGSTLRHDHVVRVYRPSTSWPAREGLRERLEAPAAPDGGSRRVVFVVTDERGGRPLQAVALGC